MANPIKEIIAIDPGKTTGFVHFKLSNHQFLPLQWKEIQWEEHWMFLDKLHQELQLAKGSSLEIVVAIESFRLFAAEAVHQINSDFPSSQIIGVMKYICATTNTELVIQSPSIKKQFPDRELLKWLQADEPLPTSLHLRDAARHAYYLYFDRRLRRK